MKRLIALAVVCLLLGACVDRKKESLYTAASYGVYHDRVEQGKWKAKAVSPFEMSSSYESMANQFLSPAISFKFSINGKDNEMPSGIDHHFTCIASNGICETPLIVFGKQLRHIAPTEGVYLEPETKLTIRLDMREVLKSFETTGYYTTFNGSKIYKDDFKGVYVAGGTPPLSWDFDNLHNFDHLELADPDHDGIYELELLLNSAQFIRRQSDSWKRSLDIDAFPQYTSPFPLVNSLYNLSLEEMVRAVEPDSTLRTGKEWAGVWTRDVSYSILLSMAAMQTKAAQYSLRRKIKDGVIIQDTGTGGAYPVSTDRMVWALAAWEIYKVTGDINWLNEVYPVIKKSIEDDLVNAFDETTGLMKGESSFLDWREQTYPEWMEPADIFESQCLGTNAVHYQANVILSRMAKIKGESDVERKHRDVANRIRDGINRYLWVEDRGYYGQFRYGRNAKIISPRSEALGEALTVLFDIADAETADRVVASTPVYEFGIPCIYPQIPNIPPYHNNAVWPFVQAYWALAAAKAGNETSVMHSLASIWRPAALFLTNKENFVASSGDFASTQINSDNMLWSLSGNIAMIHNVIFGISYTEDGLTFNPFVPKALNGSHELRNYRYRNTMLDMFVHGHGNRIASITLDGKPLARHGIPASLEGRHRVEITLEGNDIGGDVNLVQHYESPPAPTLQVTDGSVRWQKISNAKTYRVLINGQMVATTPDTVFTPLPRVGEIQVIAIDGRGIESFASEPALLNVENDVIKVEAENGYHVSESQYAGFSGRGYVRHNQAAPTLRFSVSIPDDGRYAVDFRYSNGYGPVNTENKCAIRQVSLNNNFAGTLVLPQRGKNEWSDWGYSNRLVLNLEKGKQEIAISYDPVNRNMHGETNEAFVDFVRVFKID